MWMRGHSHGRCAAIMVFWSAHTVSHLGHTQKKPIIIQTQRISAIKRGHNLKRQAHPHRKCWFARHNPLTHPFPTLNHRNMTSPREDVDTHHAYRFHQTACQMASMWAAFLLVLVPTVTGLTALYYNDGYLDALPHVLWGAGIVWAGEVHKVYAIVAGFILVSYQWVQMGSSMRTRYRDIGEYSIGFGTTLFFLTVWRLIVLKWNDTNNRKKPAVSARDRSSSKAGLLSGDV